LSGAGHVRALKCRQRWEKEIGQICDVAKKRFLLAGINPIGATVKKVRYAVVGLGHISQVALLPAFKHAKNSELAALVSDDSKKRKELAKRYRLNPESTYSYEEYEQCLKSGDVDAVYIGLPNHLHCEYTVQAARAGVHVLCEKPMAVNEKECEQMIAACEESRTKLMIAYRLHFEEANLEAVKIATSGKLGNLRIFSSTLRRMSRRTTCA
jgi:predicted dehydrogenase